MPKESNSKSMTSADSDRHAALSLMVQGRDLPWLLNQWVKRQPDKVFLIWAASEASDQSASEDRQWTYAQFDDAVRRCAAGLRVLGASRGQRVLLHMENSPEFLITYFACALLGLVSVISNTRSVARELKASMALAEVVGVITQHNFLPLFTESENLSFIVVGDPLTNVKEDNTEAIKGDDGNRSVDISVDHDLPTKPVAFSQLLEHPAFNETRKPNPHADLRVQFTSGTTSQPKAVLSTHANAIYAAQQTALGYGLQNQDTCQVFVPLFHTNGLSTLVTSTLWVGGTVLLQRKFSASNFWPPALRYKATWTCLPGAFFVQALLQQAVPKHRFRFWIVNCNADMAEHFGIAARGHWGMTEMITLPILCDPYHTLPEGSIGRPAAGMEVLVKHTSGRPCLAGETGVLFVRGCRGISLFKEYLNDLKATAASFDTEGWFNTGDRIRIDSDGNFFFDGREKDLLRVGGENVAVSEIEAVIAQNEWVSECAVVGQQHDMLEEVPVAFVIAKASAPETLKQDLMASCEQQLADFKRIREVYFVDDFPRASLQKIAKYKLKQNLAKVNSIRQVTV